MGETPGRFPRLRFTTPRGIYTFRPALFRIGHTDIRVQMPNIRRAVEYVKKRLGSPRPLINEEMETDGTDIFVTTLGALINASQNDQLAMKAVLQEYLERIARQAMRQPC